MATLCIASYDTTKTGIYQAGFAPDTLDFAPKGLIPTKEVPTYIRFQQGLLAVSSKGAIALAEKRLPTPGISYTHLALSPDGSYLAAADYHQGATDLFHVEKTLQKADRLRHQGSGPDPKRQDRAYIHYVAFTPDGGYLLAVDLGSDLIRAFSYASGQLIPYAPLTTAIRPGAGPRHLVFSKDGRFMYVVNELDSTVDGFRYTEEGFEHFQTISTLAAPNPASFAAAIRLSGSGRSLIVTNRGDDGVAYFDRDLETGRLRLMAIAPCKKHPRGAIIYQDRFVFAAAMEADEVQLFLLDEDQKNLTATDKSIPVPKPASLAIM